VSALALALLRAGAASPRCLAMKRAGADFFSPASAKAPCTGWRVVKEGASVYMLRTDTASAPSAKIAAFDMARCALVSRAALAPRGQTR
jgi:hypothetical protein